MIFSYNLRLNLFGLETQYHFDMVVCICLEAIYVYFDEVQKLSIQDKEI